MYNRYLYPDELYHYGVKHRSGRYPYGSGNRPHQHEKIPLINPGKTLKEDIISGIKKGINIAAPIFIASHIHLAGLNYALNRKITGGIAKTIIKNAIGAGSNAFKTGISGGTTAVKDILIDYIKGLIGK